MTTENEQLLAEIAFLTKVADVEPFASETPIRDGGALVIRDDKLGVEVVVEVRLPGSTEALTGKSETEQGRMWIFLQNTSDAPLKVRAPNFILTGGLGLPWHVGFELMTNPYRGEFGEVLSWQVHITGDEALELLAADVAEIVKKCRSVAARSRRT